MVRANGKVSACKIALPHSGELHVNKNSGAQYGFRHSSAIEISQKTDAIMILISKTRKITIFKDGKEV